VLIQHALRGICYPIVASACPNLGACLVCPDPSGMSCDSGRLDVISVIRLVVVVVALITLGAECGPKSPPRPPHSRYV
ncbi:hypothetical protein CTAM01_07077, partial [Colletotrichum tamarilloi]